jgi:hypothetical protein
VRHTLPCLQCAEIGRSASEFVGHVVKDHASVNRR